MVTNFFRYLSFKSCIRLSFYYFFEISRINSSNDVDEELSSRAFFIHEVVMEVLFDFLIVHDLCYDGVHAELTVEWKNHIVDFSILETRLFATKELTNELAVDILVFVEVALTTIKVSEVMF